MTEERIRAVGILAMCVITVLTDKREVRIPPVSTVCLSQIVRLKYPYPPYSLLLIKKQVFEEKILYNRLMEEKAKCLGLELVPEFLPSVRVKLGNKLVHRYRVTRLTFLAALKILL
jgi:hypothetical protein